MGRLRINIDDLVGKKFGRLTIIEISGRDNNGKYMAKAICECGGIKKCLLQNITRLLTRSCGCLGIENITKHGLVKHPLYWVWNNIKTRCYDIKHNTYSHYGSKGVTMCDEWKNDFVSFYNWAINNGWVRGLKVDKDIKCPQGKTPIYCPEYCSIVTQKQNMRKKVTNHMIEYNGEIMCLREWSEKLGINYGCLSGRLKRKWPIEKVFSKESYKFNQTRKTA